MTEKLIFLGLTFSKLVPVKKILCVTSGCVETNKIKMYFWTVKAEKNRLLEKGY